MTLTLILALKVYLAVWFWCEFSPLQELINKLFSKLPSNMFTDTIYVALGCAKCLTLWFTLAITGNIWIALFASMTAKIQEGLKCN